MNRGLRFAILLALSACAGSADGGDCPPPGAPSSGGTTAPAAPETAVDPGRVDANVIESAFEVAPSVAEDGTVKVTWPREDVAVEIDGEPFAPPAGLTSWAAFAGLPSGEAMVMGDTVVFEDEVDAAMDAAFAHGLEVTALHNHFFFDDPPVYFMHVGGTGDLGALAAGIRATWDAIREVRRTSAAPAESFGPQEVPADGELDAAAIGAALGIEARNVGGGVVKASVGRSATMHGVRVGAPMGLTTWAAFRGSDPVATVDGDFIMTADEVQPVLRAMREHGLHVVALHNHMLGGEPFYFFTHYWGSGSAEELARAVRAVLALTGTGD